MKALRQDGCAVVGGMIVEREEQIAVGFGVAGIVVENGVPLFNGLIDLPRGMQANAEIAVGFQIIRAKPEGPAASVDRFTGQAGGLKSGPDVIPRFGEFRIDFEGTAVSEAGFVELTSIPEGVAKIVVHLCEARRELEGASPGGDCLVELPDGRVGLAEIVPGIDVIGFIAEHFVVFPRWLLRCAPGPREGITEVVFRELRRERDSDGGLRGRPRLSPRKGVLAGGHSRGCYELPRSQARARWRGASR